MAARTTKARTTKPRKQKTPKASTLQTAKTRKAPKTATARKPPKTQNSRKSAGRTKKDGSPLGKVREICLPLPDTTEVQSWGAPTFRVKSKIFAMYSNGDGHHGDGRPSVWIYADATEQDFVIRSRPNRYFKPPYVGPSGWIGAWLDKNPPWSEIGELLRDGHERRLKR